MKRILPLILTVLLLPALLAVPALAAEDSTWYNMLDYGTLNNTGNHFIWMDSGSSFTYNMPFLGQVRKVDILVSSTYSFTKVELSRNGSTWVQADCYTLGTDLKRIVFDGALSGEGYILVRITSPSSVIYLTVVSFKISFLETDTFASPVYGNVKHGPQHITTSQFTFAGGESYSSKVTLGNGTTGTYSFEAELYFTDWYKFDFLSFAIDSKVSSVTAIAAYVNGQSVPIQVVSPPYAGIKPDYWFYSVSLDLTGIDKNYSNSGSSVEDSLVVVFNGSYQDGDGVEDYICLAYSTGSVLVEKQSVISYWFFQLESWFDELISAVGGSNDASGVQDSINSAVGELEQAGAALDAVQRPDIGHVNIDVAGMVDPAGLSGVASIVGLFTGNTLIYSIMLMFLTLALISYIIFGKR